MPLSELIGFAAAILTTASFVPQALHTFQTIANAITLALAASILVMKLRY
jgi:uncharacterized protein with PQ loop repeat